MLTSQEAADILGVTRQHIAWLIREKGYLKATKHGRDYLIDPADVEAAKSRPVPGRPKAKPKKRRKSP